jgi:hypothetical protein
VARLLLVIMPTPLWSSTDFRLPWSKGKFLLNWFNRPSNMPLILAEQVNRITETRSWCVMKK